MELLQGPYMRESMERDTTILGQIQGQQAKRSIGYPDATSVGNDAWTLCHWKLMLRMNLSRVVLYKVNWFCLFVCLFSPCIYGDRMLIKIFTDKVKYIWTSGRLCDFKGCDRPDLQPLSINGWFWTAVLQKLAPTTDRSQNDWSESGG